MNTYQYIFLLFGITLGLYMAGYQPLIFQNLDTYTSLDPQLDFFDLVFQFLLSWEALLAAGTIVATLIITGFNLIVVIPFILMSVLFPLMVYPITTLNPGGLPPEVAAIVSAFFALSTFLVVISFVRTGE